GWWRSVANHLPGRSDVQCRSRWYQTLHPHTNRGDWSEEEVGRLRALVETHGPNWVKIAGEMGSGRTRQQVKQMHSRLVREETRREKAREKEKEAERVRKEQREGRGRVAQGKGGGGRRSQEPEPG
ncbi:myb-like dna-binding domain containing protein, partial [Nannochloropsis gaditana CCMP526]|uniref:myb-like dna-binding domain containing protein n=1 Tax=Nannochloropsis gaditana (strain CCMP526) TaxID=1093141 RepID=UPI00029F58A2